MPARVCILTAGQGTRMGSALSRFNKALLPLDEVALITHLIRAFPADTEFVIGLGYESEQVRGYLTLAHPETCFTFVDVDPWHGPGSGPGRSLLACSPHLQQPFYFLACDSLPRAPLPLADDEDWIAVSRVPAEDSHTYCNARCTEHRVVDLIDKSRADGPSDFAFTGIMHIRSYERFWDGLRSSEVIAGEHQVSSGLRALVNAGTLHAHQIDWCDVGDESAYRTEVIARHGFDFSKPGEALYLTGTRVIKMFTDAQAAEQRVARGRAGARVFPRLLDTPPGFVSYDFVPGRPVYDAITPARFQALLQWCDDELWHTVAVDPASFRSACSAFYRDKTMQRLKLLARNAPAPLTHVNDEPIPALDAVVESIPWEELTTGVPVFFHGDLQFDNILLTPTEEFVLLDWRSDFGGNLEVGDLYYDLGKLLGGIWMNYGRIKTGEISCTQHDGRLTYTVPTAPNPEQLTDVLREFAESHGLDWNRIEMTTGLIYLNMAPLHHPPFREILVGEACRRLAGIPCSS